MLAVGSDPWTLTVTTVWPSRVAREVQHHPLHAEAAGDVPAAAESAPKEPEPEAHAGAVLRAIW